MKASQDEQRDMVRAAITRALEIIRDRSEVKNFRFECKSLLYDMFPDAYMTPFVFSTESESPAAQMIRDNFCLIEKNMRVTSLAKYTDALDSIGIIPECLSEEFYAHSVAAKTANISAGSIAMRIFGCMSRSCLLCRHRRKNGWRGASRLSAIRWKLLRRGVGRRNCGLIWMSCCVTFSRRKQLQ